MHERWKIDRKIPLALLITLLMQFAAGLIWATQLDARVGGLEQRSHDTAMLVEKFARLEERIEHVRQDIALLRESLVDNH